MNTHHPFHTLKKLTLDPERKASLRAELSSYADLHALPEGVAVPAASPLRGLLANTRRLYAGALAALLIVLGGTQASLAAEGALPGDVLYPIKVAVNEPLALGLSFVPERKAELAAEFAGRRLDEAAKLSAAGKLDERHASELATRFDEHVETLARETATLESKGSLAASLAVRTDLESHLAERTGAFAKREEPAPEAATFAAAKVASEEAAPAEDFAARVLEKSKTIATTRAKLDTALALDLEAKADVRALSRSATATEAFSAKLSASEEATTTASTTEESKEAKKARTLPSFPSQRFFMPFGR